MLIYSENRLVPTDINMMVIKAKDDSGYFYIHRALYDQAVIINDIYGENPDQLILALTGSEESRPDVDYFIENAPAPINILGPFLLLVKSELEEFVDMVGAIHVMSGPIHLRNMLKVPFEMRNTVPQFSLSIKEEYQLAWDRFFQNALPYSEDMYIMQAMPMNGVQTMTYGQDYVQDEETSEEDDYDALMAALLDDSEDMFTMPEPDEEETEENSVATATPTPAPIPVVTPEPVPVTVPEPEPEPEPEKELTGVDALLSL